MKRLVPRRLWPSFGAIQRWLRTLPPRTALQKRRLLSDLSLSDEERELLRKVSSRIYYNDRMYTGDGAHYFTVGLSAISCINEALAQANLKEVHTILDLACGGGRVLRFLRARFPTADITACEIETGAIEFCSQMFKANPVLSSIKLDQVCFAAQFDLIWCGSLATHLNEYGLESLLRLFRRHLAPKGLAIFTTHGDYVAERIPRRDFDYLLTNEQIDRIGINYPQTGYGYEDYEGEDGWGVSLTSPEWIRAGLSEVGGLREVYFKARGWDDHQDVFGFVSESGS